MKKQYSGMEEPELCEELRHRYGDDVIPRLNDQEFLMEALEKDDGLLHELLRKSARAW